MSDFYAEAAKALREIAGNLADLAGTGVLGKSYVTLNIQPDHNGSDEAKVATVDAIGLALLGKAGQTNRMTGGTYHHEVHGYRGNVHVGVFGGVSAPEDRAKDEEIARLRAEVERLTATPPSTVPEPVPAVPAPIAGHYDASADSDFVCACGEAFTDDGQLSAHLAGQARAAVADESSPQGGAS